MTASRLHSFLLLTGALVAGALAYAQQPSQSTKPAPAAAAATTPSAAQPAQTAASDSKPTQAQPVKTAAAQKPADPDAQLIRDARNAGFKPKSMHGTLMFCRTAIELGSNFPVRTCYNEDQVRIKIHEYQTERNQLQQMHNTGMITH